MDIIKCFVIEKFNNHGNEFSLLEDCSDKMQYTIPSSELNGLIVSKGFVFDFVKQINLKSKKTFLIPLEINDYKLGSLYEFEITNYATTELPSGRKGYNIIVKDKNNNIISVKSFEWQHSKSWKNSHLICQVESFKNGVPILSNRDNRHPIFNVGDVYEFKVIGIVTIENKISGKVNRFFDVQGIDGCGYLVPLIPIQENSLIKLTTITCEVVIHNNQLKLNQVSVKDPFYVDVNRIVVDKSLVGKYFTPILTKVSQSPEEKKFKEQYESKSAFWIFTYCNKILPKIFYECIERIDYKSASQINELIIVFEEWIIKKGVIKSFSKLSSRKETSKKADFQLEKSLMIKRVLDLFVNKKFYSLTIEPKYYASLTIAEIFYVFRFTEINSIDETLLIKRFQELMYNPVEVNFNRYYLTLFENRIRYLRSKFFGTVELEDFSLISSATTRFKNKQQQAKYLNWSYCQFLINVIIKENQKARLILSNIFREYFYIEQNQSIKLSLIQHAFFILTDINSEITTDLLSFKEELLLNKDIAEMNPNHIAYKKSDWEILNKSFISKQPVLVNVINRTDFGFDILFNEVSGFLPTNAVSSNELIRYEFEEIDFTITARCILLCEDFNFFVATQLGAEHESFYVKNNKSLELKKGFICDGYVRAYKGFGIFISTIFGQGLLHVNQISPHVWDERRLKKHFPKSKSFKVQVEDTGEINNKLSFSLIGLLNSEMKNDYNNFLERVDNDYLATYEVDDSESNVEDNFLHFNASIQHEKAKCFEQYALIHLNLSKKIDLLLLSKQFHSTVNSARSYLLNVFIQYFEILVLVGKVIEDYSNQAWANVKLEAEKMKSSVDIKTISTFPDADKLVYFLDILALFNEKTDESIYKLYEYVSKYSVEKSDHSLKTVAKIALANNLMISETTEESDFSLKSLKIINSYLNSGVLSLKETEADRLQRELIENVKYWRGMIKEDEGQNLEFKQTFLVPHIDRMKDVYLDKLPKHDFDILINKKKKAIKHSAFKTLCAFANTNGGTLMIGVSDKKAITGLEIDFQSLKEPTRDGFGKRFDDEVKTYFGESFSQLLDKNYLMFEEGDVLIIKVKPSSEEIFMLRDEEGKESEELYIRKLSSSEQLKGRELAKFIKRKHLEMLKTNVS